MKRFNWWSIGKPLATIILVSSAMLLPKHVLSGGPSINASQTLQYKDVTDKLIVKLRDVKVARTAVLGATHMHSLTSAAGVSLTHFRAMSGDAHVLKLPYRMGITEAAVIANKLKSDPSVEYAHPDYVLRPMLVPDDPEYINQWHYHAPVAQTPYFAELAGINLPGAWDITTGSASIVIAVIDTGLVAHAEFTGRTVPGYDFISEDAPGVHENANDGNGRDNNPADPGDWINTGECGGYPGPNLASGWHGTHVAGIIGASTNNNAGVTGINWTSKILPVRVLGKCGGNLSDIVDAMRWSVNLSVSGAPVNANPARVLNLSLGGLIPGGCSAVPAFQTVINDVIATGAVVVVAAGNDNIDAVEFVPASCNGVITVAAVNRSGGRADYSNFGDLVTIAAPGGQQNFYNDANGILSTLNSGITAPNASPTGDIYTYYQGTSMATPHVTGVVSLMLSARPSITPAQVLTFLQKSVRAFPTGTGLDCTNATCGAGILDATAALRAVKAPTVNAGLTQHVAQGALVNLSGSATAVAPATVASYVWTQTGGSPTVTLNAANTATPSFTSPIGTSWTGLTFRLNVTDNLGYTGAADVVIVNSTNNQAPVFAPIGNKTVNVGSRVRFVVTATDVNGTKPVLTAFGIPSGATFSQATGVFNWLNATPIGTYSVTFSATDGVNPPVNQTITITVQNPPPPPPPSNNGGGGGCSLNKQAQFDPLLPLLLLTSVFFVIRRRVK